MNFPNSEILQHFLTHHSIVKGVALRHAPFPDLVDDIVQQVFVEFARKADQWDLKGNVRALLTTITVNVANRHWRDEMKKHPEVLKRVAENLRSLALEEDTTSDYDEELEALKVCLERLPAQSRLLINMYYFDSCSVKEIGKQLDIRSDTVCRAICRLREKLRRSINKLLSEKHAEIR